MNKIILGHFYHSENTIYLYVTHQEKVYGTIRPLGKHSSFKFDM